MTDDEDARFEALFRAHYGDVLAYAVRRCPSRQDAEDVAAETFTVAWRRLNELPPGDRTRLWLFGTARLVRLNHRRDRHRRDGLVRRLRGSIPVPGADEPGAELEDSERIRRALAQLPERDREVLQLHVWEELNAEQISQVLEVSPQAVWKRLQRARDRLTARLDHDPPDQAPSWALTGSTRKATR